jgi:hypothetical protein
MRDEKARAGIHKVDRKKENEKACRWSVLNPDIS